MASHKALRVVWLIFLRLELAFTKWIVVAHPWATVAAPHIQFTHSYELHVHQDFQEQEQLLQPLMTMN
jgi:hypothetical protein